MRLEPAWLPSAQQMKLHFPPFYLEVQHVLRIQLHIMALTQQQWMPEAKAFWMLQIMDEMRLFPRHNSDWHLMSPLKLVWIGKGQMPHL